MPYSWIPLPNTVITVARPPHDVPQLSPFPLTIRIRIWTRMIRDPIPTITPTTPAKAIYEVLIPVPRPLRVGRPPPGLPRCLPKTQAFRLPIIPGWIPMLTLIIWIPMLMRKISRTILGMKVLSILAMSCPCIRTTVSLVESNSSSSRSNRNLVVPLHNIRNTRNNDDPLPKPCIPSSLHGSRQHHGHPLHRRNTTAHLARTVGARRRLSRVRQAAPAK